MINLCACADSRERESLKEIAFRPARIKATFFSNPSRVCERSDIGTPPATCACQNRREEKFLARIIICWWWWAFCNKDAWLINCDKNKEQDYIFAPPLKRDTQRADFKMTKEKKRGKNGKIRDSRWFPARRLANQSKKKDLTVYLRC